MFHCGDGQVDPFPTVQASRQQEVPLAAAPIPPAQHRRVQHLGIKAVVMFQPRRGFEAIGKDLSYALKRESVEPTNGIALLPFSAMAYPGSPVHSSSKRS